MVVKVKKAKEKAVAKKEEAGREGLPALAESPLWALRKGIDRLFEDVFKGTARMPSLWRPFEFEPFERFERAFGTLMPKVDVTETEKEYRIAAELPGLSEDDVEVTLSDDILHIKGEKKEEKEEKGKHRYLMERRYGSFHRAFRIPESVDRDKVEATFENGVLTIVMPRSAKAVKAAKKLKIKKK